VVLPCCLCDDAAVALAAARTAIAIYLPLPEYQRQWARFGFDESDWSGAGSDRLIDACVAWGPLDDIERPMRDHVGAGASAIVLRTINPDPESHDEAWGLVEAVAPR
jgi:hypothetical protein